GLLGLSEHVNASSLLAAYSKGIFPWPIDELDGIPWFCPPKRAVLFLDELHVPKRLQRLQRKSAYEFRLSQQTRQVIEACANSKHRATEGTWISDELIEAYSAFAQQGYCYSIECYNAAEELVGGLYGVAIDRMCSGESMFYLENGASKLCLLHLFGLLRELGIRWFDCQQLTPLLEAFGARELARKDFLELLEETKGENKPLFPR
ncbi:UNVERIFIED_CONTAM: hypothetical protein GTU68_016406, partial [Idotea baltica]|nr:hypothetical protein [Idotea baltica]